MLLTLDQCLSGLAEELPDDQLRRELDIAQRLLITSARTRKAIAQHRVYCLQCELKRRAEQRDLRNPGRS